MCPCTPILGATVKRVKMNDDKEPQGNPWIKSAMIWAGVIVALLLFVSIFDSKSVAPAGSSIAYSEFRQKVQEGSVKEISIAPDSISGSFTNNKTFSPIPVRSEEHTSELQQL